MAMLVASIAHAGELLDNDFNAAAYKGNTQEVLRLLQQGAHLDAAYKCRVRAIDFAAMRGYTDMARMLIDAGANIEKTLGSRENCPRACG